VKTLLARTANALGISSQIEPKDSRYVDVRDGRERWPDVRCYGVGAAIVEVAVVHPTSQSYLRVSQRSLGAAKLRQSQKHAKLAQLAETERAPLFCVLFWRVMAGLAQRQPVSFITSRDMHWCSPHLYRVGRL